ncbi:MAG: CvpA family protein [Anaerolineae bacterium]|nr:CvpA family protein [Anaerolineae bacterium]
MNWLDIVVAVLFAVGLTGGYLQGLIRQALSLAAILCALILATFLRVPGAGLLAYPYPDMAATTRETIAFLFLAVALVVALEAIQRKALPDTHLLSIGVLDRFAGLLVAIATVPFQLGLAFLILGYLLPIHWPAGDAVRQVLLSGQESSVLMPALNNLLLALLTAVGHLLPEGTPRFLRLM